DESIFSVLQAVHSPIARIQAGDPARGTRMRIRLRLNLQQNRIYVQGRALNPLRVRMTVGDLRRTRILETLRRTRARVHGPRRVRVPAADPRRTPVSIEDLQWTRLQAEDLQAHPPKDQHSRPPPSAPMNRQPAINRLPVATLQRLYCQDPIPVRVGR